MLIHGDSLDKLKDIPDNSIDSCVTDPPYGLSFMGKKWDYDVPSIELWKEVFRVLKPGAHLLSFGGTRTYHRMVVNIEDAGFEIRDQLQWLYGSGFPKSYNISKGIDKKFGAEREVISETTKSGNIKGGAMHAGRPNKGIKTVCQNSIPSTNQAKQWDGFGTALKPSNEPIVLARKPLSEKTVVNNVLKWGTGGLNIDGCRIGTEDTRNIKKGGGGQTFHGQIEKPRISGSSCGRWPANTLFDYAASQMLDEQSGLLKNGGQNYTTKGKSIFGTEKDLAITKYAGSSGGASRFFYCAKSSKSERNAGLENETNGHPTVKPIKLMEYLVRLITPPKGIVLDPFMGSGTTGIASKKESFKFIGIELNLEYLEIARKRVANV